MKLEQSRCPSPAELERAFWSRDERARAHADGCARCGAEWTEMRDLVEVGRSIDAPGATAERQEEIRTALLSRDAAPARVERPARRWWPVAAPLAAAAAAAAIGWWAWPAREAPGPAAVVAVRRGRVLDHDGARYLQATAQPDEIVRLVDGTLTVEVEPLRDGERFRVVSGDGEVEVKGTAFDVTADQDRLHAVRVIHGVVEVRVDGAATRVLTAGQSWTAPAPPEDTAALGPPATAAPQPVSAREPEQIQSRRDAGAPAATVARSAAQQAFDDGWQAIRGGEFDRAASAFERAIAADGPRTRVAEDAHYWRSVALARAGHAERAAAVFDSFLATYPTSRHAGEATVMLGWLLFERGETSAAARRFRAALTDPSERVRTSAADGLRKSAP